jgi:5-methyltetrahydropteroyltriglutamate--homocysteine methyltransferase
MHKEVSMGSGQARILTSHVGALPRPPGLPGADPIPAGAEHVDPARATNDVVQQQRACGIDIVNDGEFGKVNFLRYVHDRLSGMTMRDPKAGEQHSANAMTNRDRNMFPQYFAAKGRIARPIIECTGPISFTGQAAVAADIANVQSALTAVGGGQGFLTAVSPNMVSLSMPNAYYRSEEEYRIALADAMHDEFRAITDAGLLLQVDDPGFAHAWQNHSEWSLKECLAWCSAGVGLLNHALRHCPSEQVRLHMCWGSYHGPHVADLELRHLIDLLYRMNVGCYSIEGGNVRHEHEWQVFAEAKLPDGRTLMPGVVSHTTDTVEHPELVAQRLLRYAGVVGRERVIAGTDCGMMRVHPEICWAKLDSVVAGAKIASARLWP